MTALGGLHMVHNHYHRTSDCSSGGSSSSNSNSSSFLHHSSSAMDVGTVGTTMKSSGRSRENSSSTSKTSSTTGTGLCKVCGDRAMGMYFGALVCIPCKTFFLRYAGDGFSFVCKAGQRCQITVASRTQCKYCRYQKCLQAGMYRRVRPAQVQLKEGQQLCVVCNDVANGIHFGAITCEGCKKFFRRGLVENKMYVCKDGQNCVINPRTRNKCRYCRYKTCLRAGMSREAIQMGRPSKAFSERLTSELNFRQQNNASVMRGSKLDSSRQYPFGVNISSSQNTSELLRQKTATSLNGLTTDWPGINLASECLSGTQTLMDGSGSWGWNGGDVGSTMGSGTGSWLLELSDGYASADQFSPSTCSDSSSYRSRVMSASSQDLMPFVGGSSRHWTMDSTDSGICPYSHLRRPRSGTFTIGADNRNTASLSAGVDALHSRHRSASFVCGTGTHSSSNTFTLPAPVLPATALASCPPMEGPSASQATDLLTVGVSFSGGSFLADNSGSFEPTLHSFNPVVLTHDISAGLADSSTMNCSQSDAAMMAVLPPGSSTGMDTRHFGDADYSNSVLSLFDSITVSNDNNNKTSTDLHDFCNNSYATSNPFLQQFNSCADLKPIALPAAEVMSSVANFLMHDNSTIPASNAIQNPIAMPPLSINCGSPMNGVSEAVQSVISVLNLAEAKLSPNTVTEVEGKLSSSSSYWLSPDLPDENLMFGDKHLEILNVVVPAYSRFVQLGDYINRQLASKHENWVSGKSGEAAEELAQWIQNEVVPVYTVSSITYFKSLPGFTGFDSRDQGTLVRLGQSSSRILVAALNWFDTKEGNFQHFLSWRHDDEFKQKLVSFATHLSTLELDNVEAALLNVLTVIATDYPGLHNVALIEDSRKQILQAFRAYTTVKYGSPNSRLETLFQYIPEVRKLGLLRHRLISLSSAADVRKSDGERQLATSSTMMSNSD